MCVATCGPRRHLVTCSSRTVIAWKTTSGTGRRRAVNNWNARFAIDCVKHSSPPRGLWRWLRRPTRLKTSTPDCGGCRISSIGSDPCVAARPHAQSPRPKTTLMLSDSGLVFVSATVQRSSRPSTLVLPPVRPVVHSLFTPRGHPLTCAADRRRASASISNGDRGLGIRPTTRSSEDSLRVRASLEPSAAMAFAGGRVSQGCRGRQQLQVQWQGLARAQPGIASWNLAGREPPSVSVSSADIFSAKAEETSWLIEIPSRRASSRARS